MKLLLILFLAFQFSFSVWAEEPAEENPHKLEYFCKMSAFYTCRNEASACMKPLNKTQEYEKALQCIDPFSECIVKAFEACEGDQKEESS